ncbi:hypothetical protein JNK13_04185 [bacterium]|nr:hypothetical protein [bacterium]
MNYLLIILLIAFIVFLFFNVWHTKHYYRPSVRYVEEQLQAALNGNDDSYTQDEFICIDIYYYPELDAIKKEYVGIIESAQYVKVDDGSGKINLNEQGKVEVEKILRKLRALPEKKNIKFDPA